MSVKYGFFNSTKEDERKYNAEEFSSVFDGFIVDGIHENIGGALQVTPGEGNNIIVNTGRAWFNNSWIYNDSYFILDLEVDNIQPLTYYIVLNFNHDRRVNTIEAILKSNFVKDEYIYPLASITVPAGNTQITEDMITDMRGSSLCPYASVMTNAYWKKINELVQAEYFGDISNMETDIESTPLMIVPSTEMINGEEVQVLKMYKSDVIKYGVDAEDNKPYAKLNIGNDNSVIGLNSAAIGHHLVVSGGCASASGLSNTASGYASHAEGLNTIASGEASHAEGHGEEYTDVNGYIKNNSPMAIGLGSHAEGGGTNATGAYSHAEGYTTPILGLNIAGGQASHVEGQDTTATNTASHAEGLGTVSSGNASHAEGYDTRAYGFYAHSEGNSSIAEGDSSHAEGCDTIAKGDCSHAEGYKNSANIEYSHVEGYENSAESLSSTAMGMSFTTKAISAHVGGINSKATSMYSFLHGIHLKDALPGPYTDRPVIAFGRYNNPGTPYTDQFLIGDGTSDADRSNVVSILNGTIYCNGVSPTGADYAEMFEWKDGNKEKENRYGLFVTLDRDKIRKCNSDDNFILGIVSGAPTVCGDSYDDTWHGRKVKDIYGNIIYEKRTFPGITDENGIEIIPESEVIMPKINPNYDPTKEYIPRSERPEWDAVGLIGKIVLIDDGSCEVNGYVKPSTNGIGTKSEETTKFRVMERINDNHIRVLVMPV